MDWALRKPVQNPKLNAQRTSVICKSNIKSGHRETGLHADLVQGLEVETLAPSSILFRSGQQLMIKDGG